MAWKKGEIPFVPAVHAVEVDEQEPVERPVSLEERRRLLGELREHVWLMNVLLIATTARPAAIVQMHCVQFNFEASLIYLNKPGRSRTRSGARW